MLTMSTAALWFMVGLVGNEDPQPASVPAETPRESVSDFKLKIALYGVGKEPLHKSDLVVHRGRAYLFDPGPPLEVIIHDPATERVELLNLKTKIRSEVMLKKLDEYQAKLRTAIESAVTKREAQGGRANEVAAAMSRDLIDPQFSVAYDAAAHRLHLRNSTVDAEVTGEPETDLARLASIYETLAILTQLDTVRHPEDIPPFSKLEALHLLMNKHRLRPLEMSFLFRLAGKPQRLRWTYQMEPSLTPRELHAIAQIENVRERCRYVRFERYGLAKTK